MQPHETISLVAPLLWCFHGVIGTRAGKAGEVDDAIARALAIGPDSTPAERTIDITTLGARTGVPGRIEIWFHRVDGHWYLTGMPGPRSWYANVRAHPRFTVHLKHGITADLPATAVPVDEPTRRRVITAVLDLQNRPEIAARVRQRQTFGDWFAHSPLVEIVFDVEERPTASSTHHDQSPNQSEGLE
ncbi:nitroreductase/quinone reductase family protein [Micromonospora sp. CPCC 205539]|uniref:nitroreductase/quinone reductase family protein n=1 Tax=Micromonospora sp. CPCC 205539 TaxID=3122408 RepID=UPI002FEEF9F5